MIYINEWLPNPVGNDASGEFVELYNAGNSAVDLSGWRIKTQSGGKLNLYGRIDAGSYLVLPRERTKLVLRNSAEKLYLYDVHSKLADESGFLGSAPEGKSFSRIDPTHNTKGQMFIWSEPTPGAVNKTPVNVIIARNDYPVGAPLSRPLGASEFFGLLLGVAVLLTAVVVFTIKTNEDLSKLLFPRDEIIR